MQWFRENAAHVAAHLPLILVAIAVAAAVMVWILRPNNRGFAQTSRSKNALRRVAIWVFPLPLIGLAIALGPMSPLFSSARKLAAHTGEVIPDVVFHGLDGREHRLTELRGQVVVVNIWATWCGPCRHELPILSELQRRYGSRGLTVVTLSDERPERIASFLQAHTPNTLNGYVTSLEWLPVKTFRPFTLILGRDGRLRDYFFGAQEFDAFEKRIQRYL